MVDQDLNPSVISQDRGKPITSMSTAQGGWKLKRRTVVSMVLIVIKHIYAPTAATAGLSFFHHQIMVVPNQTPVIARVTPRLAMNAKGLSPPVRKRPWKKNLFRDGCVS
jgi:hypothetical protein